MANINGLDQEKYHTLEEEYLGKSGSLNIICLTETHKTVDNIKMGDNIVSHNIMRKEGAEKKGGGLMVIHRKNKRINFEIVKNENKDILYFFF